MRKLLVLWLLLLVFLAACSGSARMPVAGQAIVRAAAPYLTQQEASSRKQSVSELSYNLAIELDRERDFFVGEISIDFVYQPGAQPLTIDFSQGQVLQLQVNNEARPFTYNGYFVSLQPGALRTGVNSINIRFQQHYSSDGAGLYRFEDPQDQRVYLYTDFQPYAANRVFPHFDQPDLKAPITLAVTAPAQWTVVSTSRESMVNPVGNARRWTFPATLPISSYVFSLHAGPYHVWEDRAFRYPLRLFARQSLAPYVNPELWLSYTRRGFDFFEDYFRFAYPFAKYDQLLVPDYNQGAMENVAAVTFGEFYVSRGDYTRSDRENLAGIIFHEMAHMWFGNIATMSWWNGLWLNESFATLMASLALLNEEEFADAWHSFFLQNKRWAYNEDELVTTHPIEFEVADSAAAETIFDGITYGKGASVLKQLNTYLGADAFRQGVRSYLQENAYASTELSDFMDALARSGDQELDSWSNSWLRRPGLNRLRVQLRCRGGKVQALRLQQEAPAEFPELRRQKVLLALYRLQQGRLQLMHSLPVVISGAETEVGAAKGLACPTLVYPNQDDWGYIKVVLDEASLNAVRHHVNSLSDPLQRSMLWQDLWAMVKEAQLSLDDYLQIVSANLAQEQNDLVLGSLLGSLRSACNYLHLVANGESSLRRYSGKLEQLLWRQTQHSSGDRQQIWFDAYVSLANNPAALARLEQLLTQQLQVAGLNLDQDRRWDLVAKLRQFRYPGSLALLQQEQQRDTSAAGERRALAAQVLGASPAQKVVWLEQALRRDDEYRLSRSRIIVHNLYPANQRYLMAAQAPAILAQLPQLNASQDLTFHGSVSSALLPRLCTEDSVRNLGSALAQASNYNPALLRALKIARQLDQRCVSIGRKLGNLP